MGAQEAASKRAIGVGQGYAQLGQQYGAQVGGLGQLASGQGNLAQAMQGMQQAAVHERDTGARKIRKTGRAPQVDARPLQRRMRTVS